MGRTLPTFTMAVEQAMAEWSIFRKALRRDDQMIFDSLFADARFHAQAGALLSPLEPFPVMLLCMLLEERRERLTLERRIQELEDRGSRLPS